MIKYMHLAQHEKGLVQTQVFALELSFRWCCQLWNTTSIPQLPQVDPVGLELLFNSSSSTRRREVVTKLASIAKDGKTLTMNLKMREKRGSQDDDSRGS